MCPWNLPETSLNFSICRCVADEQLKRSAWKHCSVIANSSSWSNFSRKGISKERVRTITENQASRRNDGGQREGRVSLARPHRATSCSSISRRPTRPWPLSSPFLVRCVPCHRWRRFSGSFILSPFPFRFSRAPSRGTDWTIHHRRSSLSSLRLRVPPSPSTPCLSCPLLSSFLWNHSYGGTGHTFTCVCTLVYMYLHRWIHKLTRGIQGVWCLGIWESHGPMYFSCISVFRISFVEIKYLAYKWIS